MTKILSVVLAAAALAAVATQPAAARCGPFICDNGTEITPPLQETKVVTATGRRSVSTTCTTPYGPGQIGVFGAQGFYHAGCTAVTTCPVHRCTVAEADSAILTQSRTGESVTLNERLRMSGNRHWWRDSSCAGSNTCQAHDSADFDIVPADGMIFGEVFRGDEVSVQCNGTRAGGPDNTALTQCGVRLVWKTFVN